MNTVTQPTEMKTKTYIYEVDILDGDDVCVLFVIVLPPVQPKNDWVCDETKLQRETSVLWGVARD